MRVWYRFCRWLNRSALKIFFKASVKGLENVPDGGLLIISNHQSFLDPPLVGTMLTREIYFLARKTLFANPIFGGLIRSLNSIPIDQQKVDVNGLRTIIRLLKAGQAVLLFPEGARSYDGDFLPAEAGVALVATKAKVPILPVRVFDTHKAMPRGGGGVRLHPIKLSIGKPFALSEITDKIPQTERTRQKIADALLEKVKEIS